MPSPQMSWVEEAKETTQSRAMLTLKKPAAGMLMATAVSSTAISASMVSTKNFFVRYMSRNAAQTGFSDQAIPMLPSATVIWLFS